jgi:geranylgeranyl pyrophosphate synthase
MDYTKSDHAVLAELQRPIADDLEELNRIFIEALQIDIPIVQEVGQHILKMGGKRFRPALLLLIARMGESSQEERVRAAAAVELVHTATLVHDDVIDRCTMRRGMPTVNALWDERVSLMMGDFLYSKGLAMLVDSAEQELKDILSVCTHRMSIGELLQLEQKGRFDLAEPDYNLRVGDKTASLFSAACRMGAVLAGADRALLAQWADFGESLGMAFQIVDDIFDFVGQERVIGKPTGNDIREGHATLPLIGALDRSTPEDRSRVLTLISSGEYLNGRWNEVLEFVEVNGGIEHARQRAQAFLATAREALGPEGDDPHRHALSLAVDYVIQRIR